jgi:hypothetical protein
MIRDNGAAIVCEMLQENHILKPCSFWNGGVMAIGATSFGSILAVNSTLEYLDLFQNSLG